jgi:DNA-binding FadR family transcriptional regulator
MTDHASHAPAPPGRNLTYSMLDSLGRAIVTGRYQDRSFPTEAELAKAHGVSRSVTREAMKMLAAKGLVSARPRQGTAVRPTEDWNLFDPDVLRWLLERRFSIELLRHFTQLRVAIEPEAAALAARYAGEEDRRSIAAGLARMVAAERGEDEVLDADIAFHVRSCARRRTPSTRSSATWSAPLCPTRSASPTASRAIPPASPNMAPWSTRSWRATRMPRASRWRG